MDASLCFTLLLASSDPPPTHPTSLHCCRRHLWGPQPRRGLQRRHTARHLQGPDPGQPLLLLCYNCLELPPPPPPLLVLLSPSWTTCQLCLSHFTYASSGLPRSPPPSQFILDDLREEDEATAQEKRWSVVLRCAVGSLWRLVFPSQPPLPAGSSQLTSHGAWAGLVGDV